MGISILEDLQPEEWKVLCVSVCVCVRTHTHTHTLSHSTMSNSLQTFGL